MINGKRVLAVIPARGGSKGLPGKNIRPLLGKPLIAWSVEHALGSDLIDDVVVSTDDPEIARIAAESGAEVPFLRPAELALDNTPTFPVLKHVLDSLASQGRSYEYLVLLEATSPLREPVDLDGALQMLDARPEAESIVAVADVETRHPEFIVRIGSDGLLKPYLHERVRVLRRQELDSLHFLSGTLYISRVDALLREQTFYHDRTLPYPVPKYKSYEIDDLCDFTIVEALLGARLGGKKL